MNQNGNKIRAVFEGGGVKGSGLVGAVKITEQQGYTFENVAGTSAGAIIAALIAAGFHASEMKEIMDGLDYARFKDEGIEGKIPVAGPVVSLLLTKGLYEGDYFEKWLRELLSQKNVHTFGDLIADTYWDNPRYRYKLQVIASDLTRGRLLTLPWDILDYGQEPDDLDVARAVRMSMSIPFFYKPVVLKNKTGQINYIVDGGILSNFPVWIFDEDTENLPLPTLGYKLVEPDEGKPHNIRGPVSLLTALFSTMMEAHDARYIEDTNFMRTIPIPTLGVQTTDFTLSQEKKDALYHSGVTAAQGFFERWNLVEYERSFTQRQGGRRKKLWSTQG